MHLIRRPSTPISRLPEHFYCNGQLSQQAVLSWYWWNEQQDIWTPCLAAIQLNSTPIKLLIICCSTASKSYYILISYRIRPLNMLYPAPNVLYPALTAD